jgi:ferredoxin
MRVDEAICQGHGLCQRAAPEVFQLPDDLEHAIVLRDPIPAHLSASAERALEDCPEQAIAEVTGTQQ